MAQQVKLLLAKSAFHIKALAEVPAVLLLI